MIYYVKRDLMDRIELEFIKAKDSELFTQMGSLWSADTLIERQKGIPGNKGRNIRKKMK
jgi:hypothetical protein